MDVFENRMHFFALAMLFLASCVAFANLFGKTSALWRQKYRNGSRSYSCITIVSLAFSFGAFLFGHDLLGFWAFIPALLDPGTWITAWLPVVVIRELRRNK